MSGNPILGQGTPAGGNDADIVQAGSVRPRTTQARLSCRTAQHVTKVGFATVPSTPQQHTVGAGESGGLAFFENGEVANLSMGFTVDLADGKSGSHVLYTRFSFADGSYFTIVERGSTTASPDGKNATFESSSISFVDGAGRFSGITGHGSMTGKRFAPLGVDADTNLDYVFVYSLSRDPREETQ